MQTNVNTLLQAARDTGLFETVSDRYLRDVADYPALVIAGRRKIPRAQSTAFTSYAGPWEYEILIFCRETRENDWETLEGLVTDFLSASLGSGSWELSDGPEFGNLEVISGAELLGARLFIQKHQVDRYGA